MLTAAYVVAKRTASSNMMLFCSRAAGTYSNPTSVEPLTSSGIKLVICDMAGTTVEENGLVYRVLRESMVKLAAGDSVITC